MMLTKLINGTKDLAQLHPTHILCIKQDEIGDMCYSLHVFEMLHKQFPHSKITLLCKTATITLLNNNPSITYLTSNYKDLIHNYDIIIDLRGSFRSILFAITHWPKARLDRASIRFSNSSLPQHPHEVITNLQIVAPIIESKNQTTTPKIVTSIADKKKAEDFLIDHNLKAFCVLHTGARKKLRRWDKYVELATYLKKVKKLDIIFTGDKSEVKGIHILQQQLPFETFSIAGKFNLTELAAMCELTDLYVGNESGPLHIASISGAPTLGLYGPGEPTVFYPWGKQSAVLHHVLDCNPCNQITCVHPDNPCIKRIQLVEVIDKVNSLMN
jgi:ADP-heptose:LPS heptosyltransferase